jgi:RNA polymerase sigma-70 factor (ECF subfamily)
MWSRRKDEGLGPASAEIPKMMPAGSLCDDGTLIDRTLAGEKEAFGALVSRYQDRLYNMLVHVTGSVEEARDIAQEAFVRAFLKLATFQRTAAFYTWLFRIALNLRIGRQRRERRHRAWQEQAWDEAKRSAETPGGQDPSIPLESAECVQRVRTAIRSLADDHRDVLLLRELEGCCYEEISRILGVPLGTVRSRLHRARAQLRLELVPVHKQQLK